MGFPLPSIYSCSLLLMKGSIFQVTRCGLKAYTKVSESGGGRRLGTGTEKKSSINGWQLEMITLAFFLCKAIWYSGNRPRVATKQNWVRFLA